MKFPKQKDQAEFMGKCCEFSKTLHRDNYSKRNKVTWRRSSHIQKTGWIVGFGCTYNGKFITDFDYYEHEKAYFAPSKRVNHIKVRIKPNGKSLKIFPADLKVL